MKVIACKATTAAGQPCQAHPVRSDGFCFWHSPLTEAERRAGQRQGGKGRANRARAKKRYDAESLSLGEVQGVLSVLLRDVIAGEIDKGVAVAAATVARAIAALAPLADLEARLLALETAAGIEQESA